MLQMERGVQAAECNKAHVFQVANKQKEQKISHQEKPALWNQNVQ